MKAGGVPRRGSGRPRRLPDSVAGDKGYSYPFIRRWCHRHRVRDIIPTRKDQPRARRFAKRTYRSRNRVERLINRLKQNRRIATRYEKRAANYQTMLELAAILLWL